MKHTQRILLIGYNFSPELTGIGKYSGEKINWFVQQGYDCTVITTYPYYPQWEVQAPYRNRRFWFTKETLTKKTGGLLTIYRCPTYVPAKPSGIKRMLLDLSFLFSAFLVSLLLFVRKKFDVVISVAPSFQTGLIGLLYKMFRGSKHAYHIQDLQIEAARDLGMIKSPFLIKSLLQIEKFIIKHSDFVSSISEGMINKIQLKSKKPVIFFPNWVDTEEFYPLPNKSELKRNFGFHPDEKLVLYSGALGEKQGLEIILSAANEFKAQKVKFIICGSGPHKERLIKAKEALDLDNVVFLPAQGKHKFNQFLNMADLHLVIQKANAADLVMPSKLTTILAVGGLALVAAEKGTSLHQVVSENKLGLLVVPEDTIALTNAIQKALENHYDIVRDNSRDYAMNNLNIDQVMLRYSNEITRNDNK